MSNRYHLELTATQTKDIFSIVEKLKTKKKQTAEYERQINAVFDSTGENRANFSCLVVSLRNEEDVFAEAYFELKNGEWKFPEGDHFDESAPDTDTESDDEDGEDEKEESHEEDKEEKEESHEEDKEEKEESHEEKKEDKIVDMDCLEALERETMTD